MGSTVVDLQDFAYAPGCIRTYTLYNTDKTPYSGPIATLQDG